MLMLAPSLLLTLVFFPQSISADWENSWPVPINSTANPGTVNVHANSGGRRIVRVDDTTIAICPHLTGDRTYRSFDNGVSWEAIDSDGGYSGCLITGPDNDVFHFWRKTDNIYMVKFRYDATPPDPLVIYTDSNLSEAGHGAYNMLNATVDKDGNLFVSTHWDDQNSGGGDTLYLIKSMDQGETWTPGGNARVIRLGSSAHSWGYIHLDATPENDLVCVYSEWESKSIQFAKSGDLGETWETLQIANGSMANPSILPAGEGILYVFAQSFHPFPLRGLVFNTSTDGGTNWTGWTAIDNSSLSGYADPSPGLGTDGTLFVAYRSGARPDLANVLGGAGCRERLAVSTDGGFSWDFPDDYFYDVQKHPTERTGTRSQIRYQTWWNYGGPLEWVWMQFERGGVNRPIYHEINLDVEIHDQTAIENSIIPLPAPAGYGRIYNGDRSHVGHVDFRFQGIPGDVMIVYEVYDIDNGKEVEILVNDQPAGYAPVTANNAWGGPQTLLLPDEYIMNESDNILTFNNRSNPPNQYWWGVRNVDMSLPLPDEGAYGRIKGGDENHINQVVYTFDGAKGVAAVYYDPYDIDNPFEVEIRINGILAGYTAETENDEWGERQRLILPGILVNESGLNILTFNNPSNPPNRYWWGVRNVGFSYYTDFDEGYGSPPSWTCADNAPGCTASNPNSIAPDQDTQ